MIRLTTKTTGELLLVGTLGALLVLSAPGRIVAVEPDAAIAPAPPALVTPPVASGTMRIGQVLSSSDGVWTDATSWAYQWMRDGVPITGEIGATYTVVAADIAALITCEVTASGPGGTSAPEASNALASPWRPILLARPGVLIWDSQDPYCYGGAGVGSPVTSIYTVDGVLIGSQATSGARATRASGALVFDGVDDWYDVSAHAAIADGAHTLAFGVSDLDNPASPSSLNIRTVLHVWQDSANMAQWTAIEHLSPSYSRVLYAATGVTTVTAAYATNKPSPNIATRSGAPGGSIQTVDLDTLAPLATATRPAAAQAAIYAQVGARRINAATYTQYFMGDLRHLALDNTQWSAADLDTYRACAIAAGVM